MISDVLAEAVRKIKRYQKSMPDTYGEVAVEVERVLDAMAGLRIALDAPPDPKTQRKVLPILAALRSLDTSEIATACKAVVAWAEGGKN